jgi:hypothetical protein
MGMENMQKRAVNTARKSRGLGRVAKLALMDRQSGGLGLRLVFRHDKSSGTVEFFHQGNYTEEKINSKTQVYNK